MMTDYFHWVVCKPKCEPARFARRDKTNDIYVTRLRSLARYNAHILFLVSRLASLAKWNDYRHKSLLVSRLTKLCYILKNVAFDASRLTKKPNENCFRRAKRAGS